MAKRKSKRSKRKSNNSFTVFFIVVVIIAILAFVITYLVMESDKDEVIPVATEQEKQKETVNTNTANQVAPSEELQGTWASYNDGAMLTISGRNYTIELPNVEGTLLEKGTIRIMKGKITFVDTDDDSDCSISPGVYGYKLNSEGEITFEQIDDICKSRSIRLSATWFRV